VNLTKFRTCSYHYRRLREFNEVVLIYEVIAIVLIVIVTRITPELNVKVDNLIADGPKVN